MVRLADALGLDVTAALQLGRLTRNDGGNASGREIKRDACVNHLIVDARSRNFPPSGCVKSGQDQGLRTKLASNQLGHSNFLS